MPNLRSVALFFILTLISSYSYALDSRFMAREHIIVDLERQIEWLRCSVGQRWNGNECSGNIVNLSLDLVPEAIKLANEQLGGRWRLPSKKELTSIVCKECPSPKINKEIFPNTDNAPYWTGDKSIYNSKFYVSVNFHTGFSFNRFSPIKELAVRLVRDR
tara:strand:+ start:68 stop:547 length:480 start_codon:yes stop_codon:yes gene_type:complete